LGLKPDSILATAFMKFGSRPKASAARLISSTGVPTGMSLNERKTISAGTLLGRFDLRVEAIGLQIPYLNRHNPSGFHEQPAQVANIALLTYLRESRGRRSISASAQVQRPRQNFALFEELTASLQLRFLRLLGCIKDRATLRTDLIQMSGHAIPDLSAVGNVGGAEAQGIAHARLPLDSLTRPGLSKGWRDVVLSRTRTRRHFMDTHTLRLDSRT
jgi:hypothetical protein